MNHSSIQKLLFMILLSLPCVNAASLCSDLLNLFEAKYVCLSNTYVRREQYGSVYLIKDKADNKEFFLKHSPVSKKYLDGSDITEVTKDLKDLIYVANQKDIHFDDTGVYEIYGEFEQTTLDQFLTNTNLKINPKELLALFKKIVTGVNNMYKRGIVHNDLRPYNILVNKDKEPLISGLDFTGKIDKSVKTLPFKSFKAPEVLVGLSVTQYKKLKKEKESAKVLDNIEEAGNTLDAANLADQDEQQALDLKADESQVVYSLGMILFYMMYDTTFDYENRSIPDRQTILGEGYFWTLTGTSTDLLEILLSMTRYDTKDRISLENLLTLIEEKSKTELSTVTNDSYRVSLDDDKLKLTDAGQPKIFVAYNLLYVYLGVALVLICSWIFMWNSQKKARLNCVRTELYA